MKWSKYNRFCEREFGNQPLDIFKHVWGDGYDVAKIMDTFCNWNMVLNEYRDPYGEDGCFIIRRNLQIVMIMRWLMDHKDMVLLKLL